MNYLCQGGPYHGLTLFIKGTDTGVFTVGGRTGKYVVKASSSILKPYALWQEVL